MLAFIIGLPIIMFVILIVAVKTHFEIKNEYKEECPGIYRKFKERT